MRFTKLIKTDRLLAVSLKMLWIMSRYSKGGMKDNISPTCLVLFTRVESDETSTGYDWDWNHVPMNGESVHTIFLMIANALAMDENIVTVAFLYNSRSIKDEEAYMMSMFHRDGMYPTFGCSVENCKWIFETAPLIDFEEINETKEGTDFILDSTLESLKSCLQVISQTESIVDGVSDLPVNGFGIIPSKADFKIDFSYGKDEFLKMYKEAKNSTLN